MDAAGYRDERGRYFQVHAISPDRLCNTLTKFREQEIHHVFAEPPSLRFSVHNVMDKPIVRIRQAVPDDVDDIWNIWIERPGANKRVDQENKDIYSAEFRRRLLAQDEVFRYWVAYTDNGVVGWTSLQPMRNGPSLIRTMAEDSIYIRGDHHGKGIARTLRTASFDFARRGPLEWIIGYVAENNIGPIKLWEGTKGVVILGRIPSPPKAPSRDAVIIFGWPVATAD